MHIIIATCLIYLASTVLYMYLAIGLLQASHVFMHISIPKYKTSYIAIMYAQ